MQRGRRWRGVVKLGLLVGAVGVAVVMLITVFWWPIWRVQGKANVTTIMMASGTVLYLRTPVGGVPIANAGFEIAKPGGPPFTSAKRYLVPDWTKTTLQASGGLTMTSADMPGLIVLVGILVPYSFLRRADRLAAKRAKAHACPACGYDREGLAPAAVCPECGKVATVGVTKP